jgi:hypothetical protein
LPAGHAQYRTIRKCGAEPARNAIVLAVVASTFVQPYTTSSTIWLIPVAIAEATVKRASLMRGGAMYRSYCARPEQALRNFPELPRINPGQG